MTFKPANYAEALKTFKPLKRRKGLNSKSGPKSRLNGRKPEKAHRVESPNLSNPERTERRWGTFKRHGPDSKMRKWRKVVLERDNHQCQWPLGCRTGDDRIDPHHRYKRSLRPDVKYNPDFGIGLCRTHHDRTDTHRAEAIELGLILTETYELAHK